MQSTLANRVSLLGSADLSSHCERATGCVDSSDIGKLAKDIPRASEAVKEGSIKYRTLCDIFETLEL